MEQDEIAAYIALYNNIVEAAQAALAILNDESSDEDELNIDVFLQAKEIVKQLGTVYAIDSIIEEIAEDGDED